MKQKNILRFFIVSLIINCQLSTVNCFAQTVQRERTFTASGLYGFMNGGADQFLEYDVQKLVVRDITYEGEAYTVEIYEMATPEDAFGIYSLHTFKCLRADTLGCIDCLSPYQLQAVSGKNYVSVVFPSGSQSAKDKADEVLRLYVPMDGAEKPDIPALLEIEPPYSGHLKYLRGPLSVSTASFSFSKLMEGVPYKGIWFVSRKPSKEYKALILVDDTAALERLKELFAPDAILQTGENCIYISGTEEEPDDDFGTFGF